MKILLTNDDGYQAKGIQLLKEKLAKYGEVFLLAPKEGMSGKGCSKTFRKPLTLSKINEHEFYVDGTPADCVALGVCHLFKDIDIVISGVNDGFNVSYDTMYSGTVGAVLEALTYQKPAIAFSIQDDFEICDKYFDDVMEYILNNNLLSSEYALNVNFPLGTFAKDIKLTSLYYRHDHNYFKVDEMDKNKFWPLRNIQTNFDDDQDSDCYAVNHQIISITPIDKSYYHHLIRERILNKMNK